MRRTSMAVADGDDISPRRMPALMKDIVAMAPSREGDQYADEISLGRTPEWR